VVALVWGKVLRAAAVESPPGKIDKKYGGTPVLSESHENWTGSHWTMLAGVLIVNAAALATRATRTERAAKDCILRSKSDCGLKSALRGCV